MRRTTASCWKSFCAEDGDVGLDDVEQLGDDRRHAARSAPAGKAPLEAARAAPDLDGRLKAGRVHVRRLGDERDVGAGARRLGEVAVEVARVAGEVLVRTELRRVHEDRRAPARRRGGAPRRAARRGRRGARPSSARRRSARRARRACRDQAVISAEVRMDLAGPDTVVRSARPPGTCRPRTSAA